MTVRVSFDEGKTWPVSRLIYEGSAAYSNLARLPDGRAGLLFERDGYKKISFVPFTIEWLEGKSETP
jgi:sialidase-1